MTPAALCAESAFAAALLDPHLRCPPGLRAWNGSDPAARLAVYRNNVVGSLIDALADTFPVVQALVGEPFFRAMAAVFARRSPPRSPIMARYGRGFAEFIEGFAPARSVPYLADIARLELARVRAFHAADVPVLAGATLSLALASGARIGELRLACHPSVSALRSPFAIVSLWAAHQGEGNDVPVDPDLPESAIVLRDGLDVRVLRAPVGAVEFVAALRHGRGLGEAAAAALAAAPGFDLTACLALLIDHGALSSFHLPRSPLSP